MTARQSYQALMAKRAMVAQAVVLDQSLRETTFRAPGNTVIGKVRVGIWAPCLGLGGAESWQLSLAKSVDPARVAWSGLAVLNPKMADETAVPIIGQFMPVGTGTQAARRLAEQSDVILSWAVEDAGSILGNGRRPKLVYCDHFPHNKPWSELSAWCLRDVDHVVGVSELCQPGWAGRVKCPTSIIWNAVDPTRLTVARHRDEVRMAWGIPDNAFVVGFVGRLAPEKHLDIMRLVALAASSWEGSRPVHVVLVGKGIEKDRLSKNAPANLHLVGMEANVGEALNALDLLVNPGHYESFGLSLCEAMWLGIPVISSCVGLAKIVPDLCPTFPVCDGSAAVRLVEAAYRADTEILAASAASARDFVQRHASPERFGCEWTGLLCSLKPPGPKALFDAAEHERRKLLVLGCDYRGGPGLECGCGSTRFCLAGKGRRVPGTDGLTDVTLQECINCVSGK